MNSIDEIKDMKEYYKSNTDRLINYSIRTGQYATSVILHCLKYIDNGYSDTNAVRYMTIERNKKNLQKTEIYQ